MRRVACAAIAVGVLAAGSAAAQPIVPDITADILSRAAFAKREVRIAPNSSVRIEMDRMRIAPAGLVDDRIDVTLTRRWPGAVSFRSESGLEFDVAPHAGLGVGSAGGQAEGGAMLTVSKSREQQAMERLRDLGVTDGAAFGDKGRWYLFAAASGRAVGLNMLRGERGWDRAGWSTDDTGALVGDAQIGVGWRKGAMQTSFGVLHREAKAEHAYYGYQSKADSVVAFSFAIRPGQ